MVYTLRFFSSKCSLFHNSNVFGSCIIHIKYTGCAKIKKINPAPKVKVASSIKRRSIRLICMGRDLLNLRDTYFFFYYKFQFPLKRKQPLNKINLAFSDTSSV